MSVRAPRYSKEEAARLGDEIYDRDIRSQVEPAHNDQIVAIDLDTGLWEMDADEMAADERLLSRVPDAQMWMTRVGFGYTRRFGGASLRRQA